MRQVGKFKPASNFPFEKWRNRRKFPVRGNLVQAVFIFEHSLYVSCGKACKMPSGTGDLLSDTINYLRLFFETQKVVKVGYSI